MVLTLHQYCIYLRILLTEFSYEIIIVYLSALALSANYMFRLLGKKSVNQHDKSNSSEKVQSVHKSLDVSVLNPSSIKVSVKTYAYCEHVHKIQRGPLTEGG